MQIEQTKEYQQLCDCYNVDKVVYAYEADGEDRDGYPIQGETRTFKTYQEFEKSGCYNLCITDEEDFEYHKELPKFSERKQLELIKLIAKTKVNFGLSYMELIEGNMWYCKTDFEWEIYMCNKSDRIFEIALVKLLIAQKDNLDHAKVKEILEG